VRPETTQQGIGGLPGGPGTAAASLESLVNALGMAWTSYTLYEDPRPVEAFVRAVESLASAPVHPWRAETGVDGFSIDGEPLAVRREGSLRMARRLFALGTEAVEFTGAPSGTDLIHLFDLLTPVDPPDDAPSALADTGVTTIRLLDRKMLHAEHEPDGEEEVHGAHIVENDDPSAFVLGLLEGGDADPAAVAAKFVEEYERAHLLVGIDDTWGIEELVHAFVDGFWFLPAAHRAQIFSLMLERGDRPENTVFLDQFGGIELAEMNRMFGGGGHPLLTEYLRVAAEEGGRHQDDLGDLIAGDRTESLAAEIVEQVAAVLRRSGSPGERPSDAAIERLELTLPTAVESRRSTANTMRGLFHLAATPQSVASMGKVWAGRVAAALATGDLESADAWMNAVAGLRLDEDSRRGLLEALSDDMSPPAIDTIARLLIEPRPEGPGAIAKEAAPLFAAAGLVRDLGAENTMGRRKMLLRALQVVVRLEPDSVITHLNDPRWYVARNVLVALGTSQHPRAAGHIAPLCDHADHRVRMEALGALYRIQGAGSANRLLAGTLDPDETVRTEAYRLLGGIEDPNVDRRLAEHTRSPDLTDALRSIAALGRRDTESARSALRGIAKKWPALWGRAKRLRKAALQALEAGDG